MADRVDEQDRLRLREKHQDAQISIETGISAGVNSGPNLPFRETSGVGEELSEAPASRRQNPITPGQAERGRKTAVGTGVRDGAALGRHGSSSNLAAHPAATPVVPWNTRVWLFVEAVCGLLQACFILMLAFLIGALSTLFSPTPVINAVACVVLVMPFIAIAVICSLGAVNALFICLEQYDIAIQFEQLTTSIATRLYRNHPLQAAICLRLADLLSLSGQQQTSSRLYEHVGRLAPEAWGQCGWTLDPKEFTSWLKRQGRDDDARHWTKVSAPARFVYRFQMLFSTAIMLLFIPLTMIGWYSFDAISLVHSREYAAAERSFDQACNLTNRIFGRNWAAVLFEACVAEQLMPSNWGRTYPTYMITVDPSTHVQTTQRRSPPLYSADQDGAFQDMVKTIIDKHPEVAAKVQDLRQPDPF